MAKAGAQVIELSDDSDFDVKATQGLPKRKASESNADASKSLQSSQKSSRHHPQAPESIPPPPSVAPPKLEKKPRAATMTSLPNISASPLSSRGFLGTPPVVQDEDRLDVLWGTDMPAPKQIHQIPETNSASLPAARPQDRGEKPSIPKRLEFEVDNTMQDQLSSLLKALENPNTGTPPRASATISLSAANISQRSPVSQRHLAIKSPAAPAPVATLTNSPPKPALATSAPPPRPPLAASATPEQPMSIAPKAPTKPAAAPSPAPSPKVISTPSPSPATKPAPTAPALVRINTSPIVAPAPKAINKPPPAPPPVVSKPTAAVPTIVKPPPVSTPGAPKAPLPVAVPVVRPTTPVQPPALKQPAPVAHAPPSVVRATSLPSPNPSAIAGAPLQREPASLPTLPPATIAKPSGSVRPPPPAQLAPPVIETSYLTDEQLDQLLSDPVTLSQIDQWSAAPPSDSVPQLPVPILSAPLSTVRFPPGAPGNAHRMRVISAVHYDSTLPQGNNGAKRARVFVKRVALRDERTGATRYAMLKDDWTTLELQQNDIVNVIGDFDAQDTCVIDGQHNFLIHHPDTLVNITFITSTSPCLRRALLGERYRGYSQNKEAVYGTLIHGVFQSVLHRGDFSRDAFLHAITREMEASLGTLFAVGESEEAARQRLEGFIPSMQAWQKTFVTTEPGEGMQRSVSFGKQQGMSITIPKILEIEECICSPVYGIKGKIDVSVEAKTADGRFVAPLELKGGKRHGQESSIFHKAQGLLFYLAEQMEGLKKDANVLRSLLVNRNQVARHLATNTLPPPIRDSYQCSRCSVQSLCMIVHKLTENGTAESSGIPEHFACTSHLTDEHAAFLRKWDRIVDLEAAEYVREQPWLHTSMEQEKRGRCLADMVLEKQEVSNGAYLYYFRKRIVPLDAASPMSQSSRTSLLDLFEAARGDFVSLSTEDGHYGVARGSIAELAPQYIVVALDDELRVLPRSLDESSNAQMSNGGNGGNAAEPAPLEGLLDIERVFDCLTPGSPVRASHHYRSRARLRESIAKPQVWRIDREDLVSTEGTVRNNVAMLFTTPESPLRSLVVDLVPPQFDVEAGDARLARLPAESLRMLNGDQRRSLSMVLAAKHYALILGMPGTGKSTTIVSIVQALVSLRHSVLITSYTNNAVDNLLLKLAAAGVDFLRITSRRRDSAKELEKYTLSAVRHRSLEEYRNFVETRLVVGATCLNAQHPVISRRRFDYCIVDEASQITLPICLGPLRNADIFVLVGDHFQLPPVVRSQEARQLGGDSSLFRLLAEKHPSALAALEYQYRMNTEIMALPNALVYEGRLQCGTQSIATRRLPLPTFGSLSELLTVGHWLLSAVNPEQAVVFLNTDAMGMSEITMDGASTGGVANKTEVKLVVRLAHALYVSGLDPARIGVITPYRAQLRFIKYGLGDALRCQIEVDTVDRYQGRDKDCIIISLVRSNARNEVGELLLDARRLNVALSRAKCKLVLIGSKGTFAQAAIYATLFRILSDQRAVFDLPENATRDSAEVAEAATRMLRQRAGN